LIFVSNWQINYYTKLSNFDTPDFCNRYFHLIDDLKTIKHNKVFKDLFAILVNIFSKNCIIFFKILYKYWLLQKNIFLYDKNIEFRLFENLFNEIFINNNNINHNINNNNNNENNSEFIHNKFNFHEYFNKIFEKYIFQMLHVTPLCWLFICLFLLLDAQRYAHHEYVLPFCRNNNANCNFENDVKVFTICGLFFS
jgi:hypothetical protein